MPALRVDEQISCVYLVLLQVESGNVSVVGDDKTDMIIVSPGTDIIPEFPSVSAHSWGGELDLGDNNERIRDIASSDTEGKLQIEIVEECCGCQIQAHNGESWQWLRLRNSLITDAS